MRCAHCNQGIMRLVRFQQRQEVYACNGCGAESLLLDCHFCERRAVRRLPDSEQGLQRWACHRCQVPQIKCPACRRGWVLPEAALTPGQSGLCCDHCQQHWPDEAALTAG